MPNDQSGKTEQRKLYRSITILGAVGVVFGIINLLIRGELISEGQSQSSFIMMLGYIALAVGLFALVGGLVMMASKK